MLHVSKVRALVVLILAGCGASTPDGMIVIERDSPAIQNGALAESIGIETHGGVFAPLLEPGCAMPCETTFNFSTAVDDQVEISVSFFRGAARRASENQALGIFVVTGIPAKPRGQAQIVFTLLASEGGVFLSAKDLSGAKIRLDRQP